MEELINKSLNAILSMKDPASIKLELELFYYRVKLESSMERSKEMDKSFEEIFNKKRVA